MYSILEDLRCFTVSPTKATLLPGETIILTLTYDHAYLKYGGFHSIPILMKLGTVCPQECSFALVKNLPYFLLPPVPFYLIFFSLPSSFFICFFSSFFFSFVLSIYLSFISFFLSIFLQFSISRLHTVFLVNRIFNSSRNFFLSFSSSSSSFFFPIV